MCSKYHWLSASSTITKSLSSIDDGILRIRTANHSHFRHTIEKVIFYEVHLWRNLRNATYHTSYKWDFAMENLLSTFLNLLLSLISKWKVASYSHSLSKSFVSPPSESLSGWLKINFKSCLLIYATFWVSFYLVVAVG